MENVKLISTLSTTPGKKNNVIEFLNKYVDRIKGRPGCIAMEVYDGGAEKEQLIFIETWHDQSSLESHLNSNEFRKYVPFMSRHTHELKVNKVTSIIPSCI